MALKKFIFGTGLALIAMTTFARSIGLPGPGTEIAPRPIALPSSADISKSATLLAKPSPTPNVASTAELTAVPTLSALPPLNLSDMALWNWNGIWTGSEWNNPNSPIPWRYSRIRQARRADTTFTLDSGGAPQLQAVNGTRAYSRGLWETEVTLPQMRDGMIVAPLWLYDPASRDEIDFEFAGKKGLDVTLHVYVNGVHRSDAVRLMAGSDMSGRRMRFGIKVDQAAGYAEMYVNGLMVKRWNRNEMPFFVSHPMKPWIEIWAANPADSGFVQWVGKWTNFGAGESAKMIVHGYRFTAIP